MKKASLMILALVLSFGPGLAAVEEEAAVSSETPTPAEQRLGWFQNHLKLKQESPFKNLKWRSIGPTAMSGRITDIAVPTGSPFTFYVSAASGGVWKTTNNGTTWQPIWDEAPSNSVGDIAVSPSDTSILWVGAGENNSSRSSYSGTGVYKSTDAGKTWAPMGLGDTHHIGRILIHPQNPETVYVAAIGHLYTRNDERGVFKTTDGGKTWAKVFFVNDNTGVIDIVMDPENPGVLYAAAWERQRKAWNMVEYGQGSGIYKTTDAGATWQRLTTGLPMGEFVGRIGLDVAASNSKVVYALVDNHNSRPEEKPKGLDPYGIAELEKVIIGAEVYRSNDKGLTWRKVNTFDLRNLYSTYGYYFGEIRVSPDDAEEIYLLGVPLLHSRDGGRTFMQLSYQGLHGDLQALWIDPENTDRLICGNDGGVNISYDRGVTWLDIPMPLGQFYFVTVDMERPFNVYGSIQDNGCWSGPITSVPGAAEDWRSFPGGEASYIALDPFDPNTLYSEGYYGALMRVDRKTGEVKNIKPKVGENEPKLRCNWLTPFIISPHNPYILYFGAQRVYMSLDRGDNWQSISLDLTSPTLEKQGDVPFSTITTLSESPLKPGLLYVGTDDGNVQVTKNGGAEWTMINAGLPEQKWVSRVVASKFDQGRTYVSLNGYRDDDFAAYVYKSEDYGTSWQDIGRGLPGGPVNVIKEDPKKPDILYAGTDLGVYVSLNRGETWLSLCADLPTTFVHDLVVHPRDDLLVIGTHGRSVWVLDVSPIQEFSQEVANKDLHLFTIKPLTLTRQRGAQPEASIHFYLKNVQPVKMEIADSAGKVVKTLEIQGAAGLNTAFWDLIVVAQDPQAGRAAPGKYTVTLTAGTAKTSGSLEIKPPQ